jgi:hypothetical protein
VTVQRTRRGRRQHCLPRVRDINEGQEFVGGASFEALGDIVGHGERRAVQLVAKAARGLEPLVFEQFLRQFVKFGGLPPDGQVLESLLGHDVSVEGWESVLDES